MHYYAIINEEYIVMEVTSSSTVINDPNYIEITEEQYNDEGFLGYFYDQDKDEFVGAMGWMCTSNEIRYDETYRTLTGKLNEIEENIATHTHDGYVSSDDLQVLEDIVDTKADTNHTHDEYSLIGHTHDDYATQVALDELEVEVNSKADSVHSHTEYATVSAVDELATTVSGKANVSHAHDDVYYTETEIDTKLAAKSDSSHNHTGVYDANGAAASALTSANAYTDSKIDALVGEGASITLDTIGEIFTAIEDNQDAINLLNSAIGNKANASDLTSHANNTEIHITNIERESWNAKSNFSGNYNDLTNKPSIPSINGLATEDYVDEKVDGITVESIGALPDTTVIPTVPTNVSAFTNDAGYLTEHQSLNGYATETYVNTQIDTIDIPDALSDLTTDSTHRVVTDAEKSAWNAKSNFSGSYNDLSDKPTIPSISGLATETYVDEAVSAKANSSHIHDDRYYTETEINTKLSAKSDSTHNHNTSYDVLGAANTALASAKEYTDDAITDEVTARDTAIATAKSSAISTAASDATTKANNALASAKTYADSVVATVKNDLLNGAGAAYDTLKELGDLIDDNVDAIEALEAVAAGKANASHTHTIANITNLQTTLDGKAATSHGTHVSYSTTTPVMDGSASVGTASTVARSDHKHPTDTSRAAQTSLDSHTGNKSNPHGVTLSHLGVTATAAELNYVDGVTSNVQTQLDGKAASSHTHNYAGSSSAGGAATSANKLNTNAGSATQPVYFANGVPVATTYTLGKSVPADAKFSDTTYSAATASANGLMSASDKSKLDGMVLATVSEVETYLAI